MGDDILTAPEVAKMMRVTSRTVTEWCESGKLRAFRPGQRGRWKIRRADLEEFINHNQEAQPDKQNPKAKGLAVTY